MAFFGSEMDFFWVSTRVLKSLVFNIRSWTQIMKPEFWHIRKTKCFQFPANLFFNNFWFYSLFLCNPQEWNLKFATYFSVIAVWCSAAKESFQTQLIKTRVLPIFLGCQNWGFPHSGSKRILEAQNWRS